ncbi:putative cytochrome P450 oxidoreductase [Xylariaceae sp. AK1471]|nr:putative cytochrome P450 oxidoreductase [Xylariaceae sp. AK1471]
MDSIYLVAFGILLLAIQVYRLAFPRPYPNIPYHKASSKRIWGDVPEMLAAIKITEDPSHFAFQQCQKLNSPVVQLFFGPFAKPAIFIDDVREVKDILSTRTREFDRSYKSQDTLRPMLQHSSLVKVTGPAFKSQRRLWEGLMGISFMRRVAAPEMYHVALELIELFRAKAAIADGRAIYFFGDLDLAAFDVIWKIVFGVDLNAVGGEREGIVHGAKYIKQPLSKDSIAEMPVLPKPEMYETICFVIKGIEKTFTTYFQRLNHWIIRHGPTYRRKWGAKIRTVDGIINDARARLVKLSKDELIAAKETSGVVMGVRRQLLAQRGDLGSIPEPSQQEIHDELIMLLMSGHETKAGALSWAIKYLTDRPEKQDRLRKALREAFPERSNGHQPPVEEILTKSIPYMDACMEETLRCSTIASRLARTVTMDTTVLGFRIPKGASVTLSPYVGRKPMDVPEELRSRTSQQSKDNFHLHWDPEGMDDWEPERWLAEDGSFDPRKFPRLAFSAGPREFRINLTMLVLNFEFEAPPGELASMAAHQRILKVPRYCHVRLTAL